MDTKKELLENEDVLGYLISFGKYLLSDERTEGIINHPNASKMPPVDERLKQVHHSDLENWFKQQLDKTLNNETID